MAGPPTVTCPQIPSPDMSSDAATRDVIYNPSLDNPSPRHLNERGTMSTDQQRRPRRLTPARPPASFVSSAQQPPSHPPISTISSPAPSQTRQTSLPFHFPPLFQHNTTSASLASSTAKGRPIPLDDSTTQNPTSALRELNSHYPSPPRYAKSTGAESSTFSQPVIVRTYPGPPSRPTSTNRGSTFGGGIVRRAAGSTTSRGPPSVVQRIFPFAASFAGSSPAGNGMWGKSRNQAQKQASDPDDMTRLPPIEAFSFKGIMENADAYPGGTDINADLDRIAEICARSHLSLANQYEVHVAPHGSGASFLASANSNRNHHTPTGPTLQAVSSDDERQIHKHRKRRSGGRRRSVAMGTLETIMSSSRSSDEDKSKKKSAAELTEEVRGRAARKTSGDTSPASTSHSSLEAQIAQQQEESAARELARKKSTSFATAVVENTMHVPSTGETTSPRSSATLLLSEPALPQTFTNYLEIRTGEVDGEQASEMPQLDRQAVASTLVHKPESKPQGLLSTLGDWISWRPGAYTDRSGHSPSVAEGSLRELLKHVDTKGKGIDRHL